MNQRSGTPVRKGSIPMVLIIICCLGIFAVSSIFMTQNTASLDKKSELNQAAWVIAQAAVEETLLKVANNKVEHSDTQRSTYPAIATKNYSTSADELKIESLDGKKEGVEVMSRSLKDPTQANKEKEFMELMEFLPGFLTKNAANAGKSKMVPGFAATLTKRGGTYNDKWRTYMKDNPTKFDPRFVNTLEPEWIQKEGQVTGEAQTFYNTFVNAEGPANGTATGNAVKAAFDAVPVLSAIPVNDQMDMNKTSSTGAHSDAELQAFSTAYDAAMENVADHMQNRIDGCNGDFDYAIGAMMTSLARGEPCANDSNAGEETYREGARDSGMTEYTENLLTVATRVTVKKGKVSAVQPYTAQRIIRSMNLLKVVQILRKNTLAYLHSHYNLTAKDMLKLGFIADLPAATEKFDPKAKTFTKMDERFSASSGTQIRNVQLATCLANVK